MESKSSIDGTVELLQGRLSGLRREYADALPCLSDERFTVSLKYVLQDLRKLHEQIPFETWKALPEANQKEFSPDNYYNVINFRSGYKALRFIDRATKFYVALLKEEKNSKK